jgi:hypothetical protein
MWEPWHLTSYCPPEPVTGIDFLLLFLISQQHCALTTYYWLFHVDVDTSWYIHHVDASSVAVSEVICCIHLQGECYVNNVVSLLKSHWKQDSWLPRWVVISKAFSLRWVSSVVIVLLLHACLNHAATWNPSLSQTFQWFPLFGEWWNNMGISVEVSFAKT